MSSVKYRMKMEDAHTSELKLDVIHMDKEYILPS